MKDNRHDCFICKERKFRNNLIGSCVRDEAAGGYTQSVGSFCLSRSV